MELLHSCGHDARLTGTVLGKSVAATERRALQLMKVSVVFFTVNQNPQTLLGQWAREGFFCQSAALQERNAEDVVTAARLAGMLLLKHRGNGPTLLGHGGGFGFV